MSLPPPSRIYEVGGAVRDALLGLPIKDRDWVVVGATPEAMVAAGFLPVGHDFPVFLHPQTHEEYALARTERKSAPGYRGFVIHADPAVTLEEDLARRDLTINAIARAPDGHLIDPYGGQQDLSAGLFRHVSPAFAEDPVRILRVARFAARFAHFTVAPETLALMRAMVEAGEVDALVPERVWQEIARGLMEAAPARMIEILRDCGALSRLLPEVERLFGVPQRADFHPEIDTGAHLLLCLRAAAQAGASLPVRFAVLCHDLGKGTTPTDLLPRHHGHEQRSADLVGPLCERLRVPNDCRELAFAVARHHGVALRATELRPDTLLRLLTDIGALRSPQRLEDFILACACDHRGRLGFENSDYPSRAPLETALAAVRGVDAAALARQTPPEKMAEAMRTARIAAIQTSRPTPP
ncbi:MAG: multifunctional CCA addition/repair protein [Betaproteobacteria bacterium]|nr:multifunctional CCA addition/repair protein [Betaproteobacteria bacterium]